MHTSRVTTDCKYCSTTAAECMTRALVCLGADLTAAAALYKVRGLLRHGAEHLTDRQAVRLDAGLTAGDPAWEVTVAWQCYQQLRSIYHTRSPAQGRRTAEHVIASFPTCPIDEVARLGRTLRAWRAQVLAYFDTGGVSKRPAPAWPEAGFHDRQPERRRKLRTGDDAAR